MQHKPHEQLDYGVCVDTWNTTFNLLLLGTCLFSRDVKTLCVILFQNLIVKLYALSFLVIVLAFYELSLWLFCALDLVSLRSMLPSWTLLASVSLASPLSHKHE